MATRAAVRGKLNAFIKKVDAKEKNGQLTSGEADQLRDSANAIKTSLGFPLRIIIFYLNFIILEFTYNH